MLIIGSLNSSEEGVRSLLERRDEEALLKAASHHLKMGASMLAINTAIAKEELGDMVWMMRALQKRFSIPLCLDSPHPHLFKEALPYYNSSYGPPLINSTTGEEEKMEELLPLAREHSCPIVVLLFHEQGLQGGPKERAEVGRKVLEMTREYSIPDSSVYLDPLLFPLGAHDRHGLLFLETLQLLKRAFPRAKSICGLDNISYGLPSRELLDIVFLVSLYQAQISAVMMNLTSAHGSILKAIAALNGSDPHCLSYISSYREGGLSIFKEEALYCGF